MVTATAMIATATRTAATTTAATTPGARRPDEGDPSTSALPYLFTAGAVRVAYTAVHQHWPSGRGSEVATPMWVKAPSMLARCPGELIHAVMPTAGSHEKMPMFSPQELIGAPAAASRCAQSNPESPGTPVWEKTPLVRIASLCLYAA